MIAPGTLGEVVKRLRVDNALPYLLLGMLFLSGWLFYLASIASASIVLLFAGSAVLCLAATLGLIVYAVVMEPGQLRTEKHEQIMRYVDILESNDFDEASQRALGMLIEHSDERTTSRRDAATQGRRKKL